MSYRGMRMEFYKYKSTDSFTYFNKIKEVNIDEVKEGDLVYLEVKSPLQYGTYSWTFYGKITKKTKCYFYILEYCNGLIDYCRTEQITKKESSAKPPTKQWAKKNIIKLFLVNSIEKIETRQYETNNKDYYEKICKSD